ncbi:MAG TPA: hypothetical protein VHC48_01695 [Puia sp.]|jgi:hypothetical protein|nr:hypothetical protein [Puia sp.]
MKKTIFVLLIFLCGRGIAQAQVLGALKAKVKTAAENSVDRSTDKVVDRALNKTSDTVTDKVIGKTEQKLNTLFKRKNRKKAEPQPPADSTVAKPKEI